MPRIDERLVPGTVVHCKATAVLCKAECKRLFGALHDSHFLEGIVLAAKKVASDTASGRKFTKNVVDLKLNVLKDRTKLASLGLAQVKVGPPPRDDMVTNHPVIDPGDRPVSPLPDTDVPPVHQESPETPTQRASAEFSFSDDSQGSPSSSQSNSPNSPNLLEPDPTVECHGVPWFTDNDRAEKVQNGELNYRKWFVRDRFFKQYHEGSDVSNQTDIFGYFELMFPPEALDTILAETNIQLQQIGHVAMTRGELLRFFGVMITMTRIKFDNRRDLWSLGSAGKYLPVVGLGQTGMSKNRFDAIFSSLRWSHQPPTPAEGQNSEEYRWMLVDDFVEHINAYRLKTFFRVTGSAWMSRSVGGMVWGVTGLMKVYLTMLLLTESQRTVVRSRMRPAVNRVS